MAKKKIDKTYTIKNISHEQLTVMRDALEMYTRTGIMQFDRPIDKIFNQWGGNSSFNNTYRDNQKEIETHCMEIRNLITSTDDEMSKYDPHGNWSMGIGNPKTSKDVQIAYEVEKDIDDSLRKNSRGKLNLTEETDIIVREENPREEKLSQIIKKIKEGN